MKKHGPQADDRSDDIPRGRFSPMATPFALARRRTRSSRASGKMTGAGNIVVVSSVRASYSVDHPSTNETVELVQTPDAQW